MKRGGWAIVVAGLAVAGGCRPDGATPSRAQSGMVQFGPGIERAAPLTTERVVMAESVYVPIYSSIATADNARPINLAVTLTVRNLDQTSPIIVNAIQYHDAGGKLIRESLEVPIRVGPLASMDLFLRESDNSGGASPSFLVAWVADKEVVPPMVEAVMISTAGSLGITFTSAGRVIAKRHQTAP